MAAAARVASDAPLEEDDSDGFEADYRHAVSQAHKAPQKEPDPPTEAAEEKESNVWKFSADHYEATWRQVLAENLDDETSAADRAALKAGQAWPKACIFTKLRAKSTTTKRGKSPYAYPKKGIIKIPGDASASKVKIGLHQLAAFICCRRKPLPNEHASHYMCDNDRCINPGHVIFEHTEENITRFCCKKYKVRSAYRCPHQPSCPDAVPCDV